MKWTRNDKDIIDINKTMREFARKGMIKLCNFFYKKYIYI